jgi:D-beta-D-heptose 7-phosphate kinase/D-beta-D-heptose 1-phosphate adenosyltransferase
VTRSLTAALRSLGSPRVVVIGDLMVDRYVAGAVERISPEAPIQVLRVESTEERLGGAASVAAFARVLGARTTAVGAVGEDEAAGRLATLARDAGIELLAVPVAGRRTAVKTRHLAHGHSGPQQVLRVDEESVAPVEGEAGARLLARALEAVARADAVLLSDYAKGALTPSLLRAVIDAARAARVPVIVDPKGDRYERYRGATCVTPNRAEARQATGVVVRDAASAAEAASRLVRELDLDFALITLDRDGMWLQVAGAPGEALPTTPREVYDVTGAGDIVVATLGIALASGALPTEAAQLANVAAGLEVERIGVVPVTREEIAARLAQGPEAAEGKLVPRAEVAAVVARHRAAGRRVVFTNGCFDVLHAGHVRYLAAARALGDVLVVGLNADGSVRRLKGEGRPVNPEEDRVAVLSALASVDHVVVFEEDRAVRIVAEVAPDVLVKGEDWREKGVDGRESVEARGGRVVLLPLLQGRSTTETLRRLGAS